MRGLIPLLALISTLVPNPIDASCATDPDPGCGEAEARMNRRAQEYMEAAQKRVLFVETGNDRIKTTEFDFLFGSPSECRFLQKEGRFRAVDESRKAVLASGCRCCTEFQQDREGEDYVPRARIWVLHGRYLRFIENPDPGYPALIEKDYWCGVETQWLHDGHYKSLTEGCDVPIVPRP